MHILVGIDGGPQQPAALKLAARLADGGRLTVATVYPWSPWDGRLGPDYVQTLKDAADDVLRSAREQVPAVPFEARRIADHSAPRALHRLAAALDADLLVIGACHRGAVGRAVLGGTGDRLVHGAPCPMAVAPHDYDRAEGPMRTVGVAYDGRPDAEAALAWALRLAEGSGASLQLLAGVEHVPVAMYPGVAVPPSIELMDAMRDQARRMLETTLGRLPAAQPADGRVIEGPLVPSLLEAASELDVLVTGSRGYGAVGSVLAGSVSRGLMHGATCPVVVVPRSATTDEDARDAEHAVSTAG